VQTVTQLLVVLQRFLIVNEYKRGRAVSYNCEKGLNSDEHQVNPTSKQSVLSYLVPNDFRAEGLIGQAANFGKENRGKQRMWQ